MSKNNFFGVLSGLFLPVAILIVISLVTLLSISPVYFKSQLIFLVISLIAFGFVSQVHWNILHHYMIPFYIFSILSLLLIFVIGIQSHGAVRWVDILGFRIQFSEILKPFLAVALASFLTKNDIRSFATFVKVGVLMLPIVFLIFIQPDLGNALIYIIVVILSLLLIGLPLKYFLISLLPFAVVSPLFLKILHGYQRERLMTFLHPGSDPLGTSYNAIQSIIAVGSGAMGGKGLGQGSQAVLKFLPEHQTDFIFATLSEGLGFIGSIIVIVAFVVLLYKIFAVFNDTNDVFYKNFCAVAFSLILVQFFINIGMNIGILPIVGVTLPFVSAGGSSLLSNFILLGFLAAITRRSKRGEILEIG